MEIHKKLVSASLALCFSVLPLVAAPKTNIINTAC